MMTKYFQQAFIYSLFIFLNLTFLSNIQAQCGSFSATATVVSNYNGAEISCFGAANGIACATASGGTSPYSFVWSANAQTTSCATGLAAGAYNVTVIDANNCQVSQSVTITQPSAISVSFASTSHPSCSNANGQATATASGGIGFYTFVWANGQTLATAIGLSAGLYVVTVTDANGCAGTSSTTLTANSPVTATVLSTTNVLCYGEANGTASVVAVGGSAPFWYMWSNGQTTTTSTGLSSGVHRVTATDMNGCTGSTNVTITQPAVLLSLNLSTSSAPSCGGNNGSLSAQTSGGTGAVSFLWGTSPMQTTSTATGLSAGVYFCTVTDMNGCEVSSHTTLSQASNNSISVSLVSITQPTCNNNNGFLQISASGGQGNLRFLWDANAGNQTITAATGLSAGLYQVMVTDATNCSRTETYTLSTPSSPSSSLVSIVQPSCSGANGSARAQSTGGLPPYRYLWSNGQTSQVATGLAAGNYTVQILDANNCGQTLPLQLPALNNLSLSPASITPVACGGLGSAQVNVAQGLAPYTYVWSVAGVTSQICTGLISGNVFVTVTDANGCSRSQTIFVPNSGLSLAIAIADSVVGCDSIRILTTTPTNGMSPYTYIWGNGQTTQSNRQYSPLQNATVTITDANGCVGARTYYLNQSNFWLSIGISPTACASATGQIRVTGGTGWQYIWSNGSTNVSNIGMSTQSIIQNLPESMYRLTYTTASGCKKTYWLQVNKADSCVTNVSGYVYQNNICQPNNSPCLYCLIKVSTPAQDYYTWTNAQGFYNATIPQQVTAQISFVGTRFNQAHTLYCPTNNNITVNTGTSSNISNQNFYYIQTQPRNLQLSYGWQQVVPNQIWHRQYPNICNTGNQTENGTFVLNYSPRLSFVSASNWYSNSPQVGHTVTNNPSTHSLSVTFSGLTAQNCFSPGLLFRVDSTLQLGDAVCIQANVSMTSGFEPNLNDNSFNNCTPAVVSYDPNDKQVLNHSTGNSFEGGIYPDQDRLKYFIRFQNMGTGAARRVIIRDTLPAELLPNTISDIRMSHTGSLDIFGNELVARFDSIVLEPQSVSEELSQGFISFSLERNPNMTIGSQIRNKAAIYFDFNPPVITNTAQTTLMQMVAVAETRADEISLQAMPNPFHNQLQISYELAADSKVGLSLVNALGETVLSIAKTNQNAGNQQFIISTQDLSAGVYYLLLETETGRFAQKVIKQ